MLFFLTKTLLTGLRSILTVSQKAWRIAWISSNLAHGLNNDPDKWLIDLIKLSCHSLTFRDVIL
jgi:hypothetical protein